MPQQNADNPMKMAAIQAMSILPAITMVGFPATGYAGGPPNPAPPPNPPSAQSYQFQNSAGNVFCNLTSGAAACAPSTPRGVIASS